MSRFSNVANDVNADLQFLRRVSRPTPILSIDVDEWTKLPRLSANDGYHQRQTERAGTREKMCIRDSARTAKSQLGGADTQDCPSKERPPPATTQWR